jgi:hypothetical protein
MAIGCSQGPSRFKPPKVDADSAAAEALTLYDASGDGKLDKQERTKCPGILSKLAAYDADHDEAVNEAEIAGRLKQLLRHGTGGTQLDCTVMRKGKPLGGAEVVFEPEPFLGDQVQAARGTTSAGGIAPMGIPADDLPERLKRFNIVHYGVFKVRITHPTIKLPSKYNTETELGYETEAGNPYVQFNLAE